MSIRCPSAELVERVAKEEAEQVGATMFDVICMNRSRAVSAARRGTWVRLVRDEGYPILGVAITWGCERRIIQRGLRKAGYR